MEITDQELQEFLKLYAERCGIVLDETEARIMLLRTLTLYQALLTPPSAPPKDDRPLLKKCTRQDGSPAHRPSS